MSTSTDSHQTRWMVVACLAATAATCLLAVTASGVDGSDDPIGSAAGGPTRAPLASKPTPARDKSLAERPALSPSAIGERVASALRSDGPVQDVHVDRNVHGSTVVVDLSHHHDDVPEVWHAGAAAQLSATSETAVTEVFESPPDDVLRNRVKRVADEFGLKVSSVQLLHPLETAISVAFTVDGPVGDRVEQEWSIDALRSSLVGTLPDVEGVLIQLNDPTGVPLVISGAAFRTGLGGLWFAPGQDVRFGADHGGLARQ